MGLNEELTNLKTNLDNIKTSIQNKGQTVSEEETLDTYNDKILQIPNEVIRHIELCPEVIEGSIKNIIDTKSTILRTRCFCDCQFLEKASFTNLTKINVFAFEKCFRLKELYLNTPTKVILTNKCAFRYTPFEKLVGSIFVPSILYDEYVNDEQWGYFKDIIKIKE